MGASEGVDLEWAIVELSRIKNRKAKQATRQYSKNIKQQAEKCIEHIEKALGKKYDIFHSDEKIPGVGSIFAKPEPKTDIVVFAEGKKYFISVKMAGGIQLASGQGKSTAELFMSVADSLKNETQRKVLKSIVKELETMPTRLLSENNKNRIIKEGNKNVIDEFIKKGKIIQDKSYEYWLEKHKEHLLDELLTFIAKNQQFYDALIKEALTGKKTLKQFKGASANAILSPSGFFIINESYVNKIKMKVKVDIRAKSRGGITSIAFRIETKS